VCSPDNQPAACSIARLAHAVRAFDKHGFVIASDECYSEIYFDEAHAPLGTCAAQLARRSSYPRLVVFGSLSKRSNAPGLRSGYAAGDASLIKAFLLYRTYHGGAMSAAVAAASVAAWSDEAHVRANRAQYKANSRRCSHGSPPRCRAQCRTPPFISGQPRRSTMRVSRRDSCEENVTVLPGAIWPAMRMA